MKSFIAALLLSFPLLAGAQTAMGPEAIEAANLINHPAVTSCLSDAQKSKHAAFVIQQISKSGQSSYTVAGIYISGDVMLGAGKFLIEGFTSPMVGTAYSCRVAE